MEVWVWGSGSKARVCIRSRRPDLDLRVHHLALKLSCTSSWNANRHEPQSRLMPPTSPKALSIDEATGRAEAALPGEDHVEALQIVQHHRGAPELRFESSTIQVLRLQGLDCMVRV